MLAVELLEHISTVSAVITLQSVCDVEDFGNIFMTVLIHVLRSEALVFSSMIILDIMLSLVFLTLSNLPDRMLKSSDANSISTMVVVDAQMGIC